MLLRSHRAHSRQRQIALRRRVLAQLAFNCRFRNEHQRTRRQRLAEGTEHRPIVHRLRRRNRGVGIDDLRADDGLPLITIPALRQRRPAPTRPDPPSRPPFSIEPMCSETPCAMAGLMVYSAMYRLTRTSSLPPFSPFSCRVASSSCRRFSPGADDDFAEALHRLASWTTSWRARRYRAGCPPPRWSPCG